MDITHKQAVAALNVGTAVVSVGTGVLVASGATTTVIGSTVATGAIASATVMTSAGPLVISKVAMGLFGKIIIGASVAVVTGIVVSLAVQKAYNHYQTTKNNL